MFNVLVSQSSLFEMRHQAADVLPSIVSEATEPHKHPVYTAVTLLIIQEVPSLFPRQGCTSLGASSPSVILHQNLLQSV